MLITKLRSFFVCLFWARQPPLRQDLFIHVVSRPLRDNEQHSQQTDIHAPGGIRTHNLSRRTSTDVRLILVLRGYRDRLVRSLVREKDEKVILIILTGHGLRTGLRGNCKASLISLT